MKKRRVFTLKTLAQRVHNIGGTPVRVLDHNPVLIRGEEWVTVVPADTDDGRTWEVSLTTGRVLQTGFDR